MNKILIAIALAALLVVQIFVIQKGDEVQSTILTADSVSWDQGAFQYPDGTAKITVQLLEISPRGKTLSLAVHCHSMPLAAYVMKGSVEVVKLTGESKLFTQGDAFIEVMNKWHKGVFVEKTELLVFYAGNDLLPLSIGEDGDPALAANCE
jgi:quercetin dioxygenase-like cupin family protein